MIQSSPHYQASMNLIVRGQAALREGLKCFKQAGELQLRLVAELPAERVQTRRIFTESAAALFEKAGEHARAEELRTRLRGETIL